LAEDGKEAFPFGPQSIRLTTNRETLNQLAEKRGLECASTLCLTTD
jgi:hypothetical protein